ncbi:Neurotransmitter-gated ion-channel ligand binding domain protein [Dictyocaulus viviparus]|uniref:Neurotransmitter-gated ion-channel ligand binding domain protein n=1 Tax=Dictyocaulus viviparus TaxID=29172 RepID=A0A0D8X8P2_DICVI|nr:Neurotransmitter-gated ion-channel ligand binding domain protein [Dictyocaulus viviparus]
MILNAFAFLNTKKNDSTENGLERPHMSLTPTVSNSISEIWAGDHERRLYTKLINEYNKLARPVKNESEPVMVLLGLDFQQILDIDEKHQIMHSNVWLRLSWIDHYLTWDPAEYGNIREVRLPISSIWKPDVLLYNSVDQQFDSTWPVNVVVYL